jgi:hypothetical protein
MTLTQWDQEIAPPLHRIEDFTRAVARAVQELPARPTFSTKAEAEFNETIRVIEQTLADLKDARKQFYALEAAE